MIDLRFIYMKVIGYYFIWINGYVWSRIDRVICKVDWVIFYGYIVVYFRDKGIFDYLFIYMDVFDSQVRFIGFFRFFNVLVEYKEFSSVIS